MRLNISMLSSLIDIFGRSISNVKTSAIGDNATSKPRSPTMWRKLMTLFVCIACLPATVAVAQDSENIPRRLLEDMARQQYSVLCASPKFAQCMGFSSAECTDLAQAAIEQCLLPLPAEIAPHELDNEALESCPQKVFADAGFNEQMAGECFDEAIGGEGS